MSKPSQAERKVSPLVKNKLSREVPRISHQVLLKGKRSSLGGKRRDQRRAQPHCWAFLMLRGCKRCGAKAPVPAPTVALRGRHFSPPPLLASSGERATVALLN